MAVSLFRLRRIKEQLAKTLEVLEVGMTVRGQNDFVVLALGACLKLLFY